MKESFAKAHESFLLTQRSRESASSELPEPIVRVVEKAKRSPKLAKSPSGKLSARPKSGSAKKASPRPTPNSPKVPQSPKATTPKSAAKENVQASPAS
jgi:hypothetical protein